MFLFFVVQAALEASRIVQKQQLALNLANQSLHAAFEGWSTAEANPISIYLNARSFEANSCIFFNLFLFEFNSTL